MTGLESILLVEGSDGGKGEDGTPESGARGHQQAASEDSNRGEMHDDSYARGKEVDTRQQYHDTLDYRHSSK